MPKPVWTSEQVVSQLTNWGARWDNGTPVPFMFYTQSMAHHLHKAGFGAFSEAERQSLLRSMQLVSDVANISFTNIPSTAQQPSTTNPFMGFYTINQSSVSFWGAAMGWVSEGGTPNPSGQIYGVDIVVNRYHANNPNFGGWELGTWNSRTLLHEMLHGVGLDHAGKYNKGATSYEVDASYYQDSQQYTVMSYWAAFETGANHMVNGVVQHASTPLLYDVAALQALYGANMSTRTGDTVYGFNNTSGRAAFDLALDPSAIFTIWDAGGVDTLDLSGYSSASRVDLREGAFSDAGGMTSNISIAHGVTVENAVGGAGSDSLTGNAAANRLAGGGGQDTLNGGAGNDMLIGGAGDDMMAGGSGDDTYVVDAGGDIVDETGGGGTDTIQSGVSFVLAEMLENLTLLGSAVNGTGNDLNNIIVGNALANALGGGGGNDRLDGGAGADVMTGGSGNDVYVVDDASDQAVEASGGGADRVESSVGYTLPAEIEDLILAGSAALNGTGNALANVITGNAAANILDGGLGTDTMSGGDGSDIYIVDNALDRAVETNAAGGTDLVRASVSFTLGANVEKLALTGTSNLNGSGNALANTLTGNAGNNVLDGGAGTDIMIGGEGNDIFVVDSALDNVSDTSGIDLVRSGSSYTLGDDIEKLALTGTGDRNATGNAGANSLTGNAGKNVLDGKGGADAMAGGDGNDIYVVDSAGDKVVEASAAGGVDLVKSLVSFELGANIENLALTGTGDTYATGNSLANRLTGNIGMNILKAGAGNDLLDGGADDDRLHGGAGHDSLTGGAGKDRFYFDNALDAASNVDGIFDFVAADDSIYLSRSIFASLAPGALSASAFVAGSGAADSSDRIVYNAATGNILFDADGSGAGAAVLFARVEAGTALTSADFIIY